MWYLFAGQYVLVGAAVVGLGTLVYSGQNQSCMTGTSESYVFWPKYAKERIQATSVYFAGPYLVCLVSCC